MQYPANTIENIIAFLNSSENLEDIRFVSAYNKKTPPRPVTSGYCSIGLKESTIDTNDKTEQVFEITVHMPIKSGGIGCAETMGKIAFLLLNYDKNIENIKMKNVE